MPLRRLLRSFRRADPPPSQPAARMVAEQLRARGVRDERVLAAMAAVDRSLFVPERELPRAWDDRPLPIGHAQTISQPYIVGVMTELLELRPDHRVLEIGTGSGYQTAILARLARTVHSIERISELAERAALALGDAGAGNVRLATGDGSLGWPEEAPFDRIIVTAAAEKAVPPDLFDQLAEGGVLVAPVGPPTDGDEASQTLVRWRRSGGRIEEEAIMPVRFVPLVEGRRPPAE